MDIKITCRACGQTYPLVMALDPESKPGHCPFCGEVVAFQYTPTFVSTAEAVLSTGTELTRQLTLLSELTGGFSIEGDSIVLPVREAIAVQDSRIAEPYRPGWPPATTEPVERTGA